MTVVLSPTKSKDSLYLLIPKNIANLLEVDDKTLFTLSVRGKRTKYVLEYKSDNNSQSQTGQ